MKNIILAGTAIATLAGAASAEVSWNGEAKTVYNSVSGFSYDVEANLILGTEVTNGISASVELGVVTNSTTGALEIDKYPVLRIESDYGRISYGNASKIGGASDRFSPTKGVPVISTWGTAVGSLARGDVNLSNVGFSGSVDFAPATGALSGQEYGVSGTFGAFSFGIGKGNGPAFEPVYGINIGGDFGAFTIAASYRYDDYTAASPLLTPKIESGVEMGYDLGNGYSFAAYYASDSSSASGINYGVSGTYASGPWDATLAYTNKAATPDVTLDVAYDINAETTVSAGWSQTKGTYAAVDYTVGNGITIFGSYSTGYSKPTGATLGASVEF